MDYLLRASYHNPLIYVVIQLLPGAASRPEASRRDYRPNVDDNGAINANFRTFLREALEAVMQPAGNGDLRGAQTKKTPSRRDGV
ncbi:MAG: hypothetical protein V2I51_04900 [Anderseniella sp.]|nr:hypothetical protein [Anderseniella sp.]